MKLLYIISIFSLALNFAIADERDTSIITKMEGRRLSPGERKRIQHDGECFIVQSTAAAASFIPDGSSPEVATISNTGVDTAFTRTPCSLNASAGKLLTNSENLLNNPSGFGIGDFLVIKVAGLTSNARACNRRMWGASSGRTSEPADECIAANITSNSARMADMTAQNGKPLWTYNSKRSEWTLTKEVAVTGLRFGGAIDFVFYDPTMGAGVQMGINAVSLSVQLTSESVTASAPTGTGGSGDGGGEDAGGYDGGDPDDPSAGSALTYSGSTHSESDCTSSGGQVITVSEGTLCRFNASSCPSGWSSTGYSRTTSNTESRGFSSLTCPALAACKGYSSTSVTVNAASESLTTGSHSWSKASVEKVRCRVPVCKSSRSSICDSSSWSYHSTSGGGGTTLCGGYQQTEGNKIYLINTSSGVSLASMTNAGNNSGSPIPYSSWVVANVTQIGCR